ncbi:MAG: DegT/DnrJ/EryC1/StrS family aminotransferase, partial [Halobacteriota archaeon]
MINVTKTELPPLDEYAEYLKHIWQSGWITNDGELLRLLQQRLQEHLDVKHLIVVSNGTVALHCALRAARLTGEIVTTPFTFAATTNAILWANTVPIFADIDPDTFNIDPHEVERCITDKTSAILAVHVYGNPCYVEDLQEIAKNHGLRLIFDAAHAFGVEHNKRSVLTSGDISTLSFHATKVYHTGEGGAIVSDDERIADELLLMRNHGI